MKVIPKYGDFWCKCVYVADYALLYSYIFRALYLLRLQSVSYSV